MKHFTSYLRLISLLAAVFCSITATASGTHRSPSVMYTMKDGLTSNGVYGIAQDPEGFIWFGTTNGLCRFDGQEFRSFRRHGGEDAHANNKIRRIMIDRSGLIWISLNNGVDTFNPSSGTFSHFDVATEDGSTISEQTIEIIEDRDGDIWISTVSSGIFRYTPSDGTLLQYVNAPSDEGSLSQDYVSTLYESSDGTIWAGTYSEGLCAFSKSTGRFTRYKKDNVGDGLPDNSINAITEDSYGNIWLGLVRGGVSCFDREHGVFVNYNGGSLSDRIRHVHSIAELSPGRLIVCSQYGAVEISVSDHRLTFRDDGILRGATVRSVYTYLKDREGNVWLGSQYDGAEFIPANDNFLIYRTSDMNNPYMGRLVYCVEACDGDLFYLGTENDGVKTFNAQSGDVKPFRTASDVGEDVYSVMSLLHENGRLWIGTFQRGVEMVELKTGRARSYMPDSDNPSSRVFSIMRSQGGTLYAATAGGVYAYDLQKDCFEGTGIDASVMDMCESGGNIVLLTADGGVLLYDTKTRHVEECGGPEGKSLLQSLSGVSSLAVDRNGDVWLGTFGSGLCRYDPAIDVVVRVDGTSFSNADVKKIIVDGGDLWLSTDIGVIRYTPRNAEEFHYARTGNTSTFDFISLSGAYSPSGHIVFGTGDGVCAFLPHGLVINESVPRIVITGIFVGNERLEYLTGAKNQPLRSPAEYADRVNLSYRQSSVTVTFSALSYMSPGSNVYRYRLEGHDKEWTVSNGGNNRASWNLRPGTYRLVVYGGNGDGIWNPDPRVLVIRIYPHFLKSKAAVISYFILVLLLLSALIMNIMHRSEKKHEEHLAKLKLEQERELQRSRLELFTTIVHEIRTPLSLIVGPLEYILGSDGISEKYNEYVSIINKNLDRLRVLVNQLLDFQKVDAGNYTLKPATLDVSRFVPGFLVSFSYAASKKGITLESHVEDGIKVVTDREALTKILSNLLVNAVKYASSSIVVTLKSGRNGNGFTIVVSDDGPGIPADEQDRIFEAFYQSKVRLPLGNGVGIGLYTVRKLVSLMDGSINASDNPEGPGTAFSLYIPAMSDDGAASQQEGASGDTEEYADGNDTRDDRESCDSCRSTVLIVDDNEDILNFLGTVLNEDYDVVKALNGESALRILDSEDCDLVVSDIMMDGMDGLELCRKIKSDFAMNHVPVVLLTAKTDTDTKITGLETGADAFIEKPFSPAFLKAQLASLLRNRDEIRKKYTSTPMAEMHAVAKNKLDLDFMERCRQVIIDNMTDDDLSVDVLSRELAVSRPVIFRKIKAITGMTPNNFMKLIRLNEASRMMVEGRYRITEIGFLVGFSSSSYFAKCFARQFGILPTEYVRKMTEEHK